MQTLTGSRGYLEQKINEVDKIQTIENYIEQLKERIWAVKEVLTTAEASAYLGTYRLLSTDDENVAE